MLRRRWRPCVNHDDGGLHLGVILLFHLFFFLLLLLLLLTIIMRDLWTRGRIRVGSTTPDEQLHPGGIDAQRGVGLRQRQIPHFLTVYANHLITGLQSTITVQKEKQNPIINISIENWEICFTPIHLICIDQLKGFGRNDYANEPHRGWGNFVHRPTIYANQFMQMRQLETEKTNKQTNKQTNKTNPSVQTNDDSRERCRLSDLSLIWRNELPFGQSVGDDKSDDVGRVARVGHFPHCDGDAELLGRVVIAALHGEAVETGSGGASIAAAIVAPPRSHRLARVFDVDAHRVVLFRLFFIIFLRSAISNPIQSNYMKLT